MSSWATAMTNKGRALQAKAQAGEALNYTRIAIGDGALGGQSIATLTALVSQKKTLDITTLNRPIGSIRAVIGTVIRNTDIVTGFDFREFGVFALDPDEGEILYFYGNAGDTADYLPPNGDGVIEKSFNVNVLVGDATTVTATIDQSLVYVTQQELDEALAGIVINDASLTQPGIVQLSNATDGIRENIAPTEKALGLVMAEATAGKTAGNERKAEVVAVLVAKGVSATTSESWDSLIAKLTALIKATGNAVLVDVLAGKTFSNESGNNRVGTMPDYSGYPGNGGYANAKSVKGDGQGSLVFEPNTGYYKEGINTNGYGAIIAVDPEYVPSSFRADKNIFGVQGSIPIRSGNNATLKSPVSGGGALYLYAPEGYYNGGDSTVYLVDPDFVPGNIRSGKDIFGTVGTLVEGRKTHIINVGSYQTVAAGYGSDRLEFHGVPFVPTSIIVTATYGATPRLSSISKEFGVWTLGNAGGTSDNAYIASASDVLNDGCILSVLSKNGATFYTGIQILFVS
ncbi:tail fiber protein [Paenibacillus crassostreae]|uniref:Phage tail fibre protein N-terminal domain-containing protein n=1 Tax=Paenibacillus crassostreae TaxID=1763538 RepID=A0A162RKW9_9BACL|nr:phage tail protein [Paenibacillus crassostreae]AOZ91619.1 hypothetical protein LPB68_04900 [Paenibacillus crassostreae]OAB72807.1 hypothetical protein PNBC_15350 [Paenibacillus crassostreae]